eukprot:scaffold3259_cov373-Prasinococcus_capsulatus_cf.AAC.8
MLSILPDHSGWQPPPPRSQRAVAQQMGTPPHLVWALRHTDEAAKERPLGPTMPPRSSIV